VIYVKSNEGREFKWRSDHAFLKVSAEESGGLFSMIEDNLTSDFVLPLHKHADHADHAETFFIIDGVVEVTIDGRKIEAQKGDTLPVPPNAPHAVRCLRPAKMLTLFQPGGLENLFAAYELMSAEDFDDPEKVRAVDLQHDNIVL